MNAKAAAVWIAVGAILTIAAVIGLLVTFVLRPSGEVVVRPHPDHGWTLKSVAPSASAPGASRAEIGAPASASGRGKGE